MSIQTKDKIIYFTFSLLMALMFKVMLEANNNIIKIQETVKQSNATYLKNRGMLK